MDRRRFLRAAGAGTAAAVGGCLGGTRGSPGGDETTAHTDAGGAGTRLPEQGDGSTICGEDIRYDPGIYPIVGPAFGDDWSGTTVDPKYERDGTAGLSDRASVVGVEHDGVARAYPVAVLTHHEIVNDRIGGAQADATTDPDPLPLLVTYCPLCRSGLVARRVVGGTATRFFVSGLLWEPPGVEGGVPEADGVFGAKETGGEEVSVSHSGNLVMYDEATKSFWSQLLGQAICGPERGSRLSVAPSSLTTWGRWRTANPDGEVLLPPPASETTRY